MFHEAPMTSSFSSRCLVACVLAPARASRRGQAQTPTTVNVSGGSQGASQTVPTGETRFGLRVPLKPNAENTLSLVATDTDGRTAKVDNLKVAQISLTEIVQARVTATRLSTPEVKQLVAEGVINLQDPDNYNVSRFVVALVVNGREVQVPVPVVRHKKEIVAEGPPVSVGCAGAGQGVSTTERAIFIPCGDGGNASDGPPPPIVDHPVRSRVAGRRHAEHSRRDPDRRTHQDAEGVLQGRSPADERVVALHADRADGAPRNSRRRADRDRAGGRLDSAQRHRPRQRHHRPVHRPRRHQGHPHGDRAFRRQDHRIVPARARTVFRQRFHRSRSEGPAETRREGDASRSRRRQRALRPRRSPSPTPTIRSTRSTPRWPSTSAAAPT